MDDLSSRCEHFFTSKAFGGKGALCVALVLTREAKGAVFPLKDEDFFTPKGGQVRGLGKSAVQKILEEHGITRILAEEGGRTSRGNIERMRTYVAFLNELKKAKLLDFEKLELWWIGKVADYFSSMPIRMKLDRSKSSTSIILEIIEAAFARQKEGQGQMVAGTVMQHLVGAKLAIALPAVKLVHHGASVADSPGNRKGDFLIEDTVIHVTTAPTEALVRKCKDNIAANLHPIIITTAEGVHGAQALMKSDLAGERIDLLEISQFISTNVFEWAGFSQNNRQIKLSELVGKYNEIVDTCETDPSLRISVD